MSYLTGVAWQSNAAAFLKSNFLFQPGIIPFKPGNFRLLELLACQLYNMA
jgi:hypothetical protein